MSGTEQKANISTISQVNSGNIKSEPTEVELDRESEGSDNNEEEIYKNLTEDQLLRARKYNECFICQKRCASFSSFRSHVFQHTSAKKFKCEKCFKEFAQLKYLKAHLTTHNENRVFTCEICSQNFATKSSIRGHMRVHTGEKPYKCEVCDKAFSESSTRRKHILVHFPERKQQLRMEDITCEICGKTIKGQDSFKRHMSIHTGAKSVQCPICSKSFAMESFLRAHIVIHSDRKKEHICKICSVGFYHRSSLWKHMKRPCPTAVFKCDVCVNVFKNIIARIQGDDMGSCKLCGKTYRTARGLSVHLRTHFAGKEFQCENCATHSKVIDKK